MPVRRNIFSRGTRANKANAEVGPDRDTQLKYYLARQRRTGDLHGQAPVLWSASALMR